MDPEAMYTEALDYGTLLDEDRIGVMLYAVKEKHNIPRAAYDAMIECINDEIMAVYGK
jgi:hypothetical protein